MIVKYNARFDALTDEDYICIRVVDALLREDVAGCINKARLMQAADPQIIVRLGQQLGNNPWLVLDSFEDGRLWLPVEHTHFMQKWRLRGLPLVWEGTSGINLLWQVDEILKRFQQATNDSAGWHFSDFSLECKTAVEHRRVCNIAQRRYFTNWRHKYGYEAASLDRLDWCARMLHYDRCAAFKDHPFYPTARAKLGMTYAELEYYSPEFQPTFRLHWLAVPRSLYSGESIVIPGLWPEHADVGLHPSLAESHVLIPVHPFMWQQLDRYMAANELRNEIIPAPYTYLDVQPTLSVRTVVSPEMPYWHIKLPLPMRTLGARNIRTIKPSTIHDGQLMQNILSEIAAKEPVVDRYLLLTDEGLGGHVEQSAYLGFILRRYPSDLENTHLVPVAAFCAPGPDNRMMVMYLAERFFSGRIFDLFEAYVDMTLRIHLLLWLGYGVALESNQQNSIIVFSDGQQKLRLLLKDNDAGRIYPARLNERCANAGKLIDRLQDRRILVDSVLPIAQMFSTITLQLNIAVLVEGIVEAGEGSYRALYGCVRHKLVSILAELQNQVGDVSEAYRVLLEDDRLYVKYLLRAASLEDKKSTGAIDINKFYGHSAPNFINSHFV